PDVKHRDTEVAEELLRFSVSLCLFFDATGCETRRHRGRRGYLRFSVSLCLFFDATGCETRRHRGRRGVSPFLRFSVFIF
ncbi:MAG: hypothetical protein R3C61_16635, partial [Bacteroidia bacterium]